MSLLNPKRSDILAERDREVGAIFDKSHACSERLELLAELSRLVVRSEGSRTSECMQLIQYYTEQEKKQRAEFDKQACSLDAEYRHLLKEGSRR